MIKLALAAVLFAIPLAAGIQLPDPSTGVIGGRVATLVWPARYASERNYHLLPAAGCRSHFVPVDDRDADDVHPCGTWVQPKRGRYLVWLEGQDYISPEPLVLNFVAEPNAKRGLSMVAPVVPSGRVRLADDITIRKEESFRLISLDTKHFVPWRRIFSRRIKDPEVPAAMPSGRVLAAVFDRATDEVIAVSRPLTLAAGATVVARPSAPVRDSDVFVILERPAGEREELRVQLAYDDGRVHPPDVLLDGVNGVFAVWYAVTGRSARLTVDSASLTLPSTSISLRPQHVSLFRGRLQKKPKLTVSVLAPEGAFDELRVTLHRDDDDVPVTTAPVAGTTHVFERVPAERLRVTLAADQWEFERDVDLTNGQDGEVTFALEPIIVHGTIRLGDDAKPGEVRFEYAGKTVAEARTNATGEYETKVWQPAMYFAHVTIDGDAAMAFIDPVDIEESGVFDFTLPDNRVIARVTDEQTGLPIADATIGVHTSAVHPSIGEMQLGQRYTTDEKGVVVLPRLRTGQATIEASAPAYSRSQPRQIAIDARTRTQLEFRLRELETSITRAVFFDGTAAIGAEACVADAAGVIQWRGAADLEGNLEIPRFASGILVVRHARAASSAVRLGKIPEVVRMAPADPQPLMIRATNASGDPVGSVLLSIWVDGIRLTNQSASFATWSGTAITNREGEWSGRNLPAGALRLLATRRVSTAELATGAYDALATTIAYPRSTRATIISVD